MDEEKDLTKEEICILLQWYEHINDWIRADAWFNGYDHKLYIKLQKIYREMLNE